MDYFAGLDLLYAGTTRMPLGPRGKNSCGPARGPDTQKRTENLGGPELSY
jgi:hypothetical protein